MRLLFKTNKYMKKYIIVSFILSLSLSISAQERSILQDSLNIPVILVDGVEVQSLDSVSKDDVVEVRVIKDKDSMRYFYPRVGGIVCITTKSKRFLNASIQRYKENLAANDKKKKRGKIWVSCKSPWMP